MTLLHSLQELAGSTVALVRGRLEVFGVELQEELARFFFSIVGAVVALLLAALGAAFAGAALVMALPESTRALAAAGLAAVFILAGLAAAWSMRHLVRAKPQPFARTLAELDRDRAAVRFALEPVAASVATADRVVAGMRSALGWAVQLAPVLTLLRRR